MNNQESFAELTDFEKLVIQVVDYDLNLPYKEWAKKYGRQAWRVIVDAHSAAIQAAETAARVDALMLYAAQFEARLTSPDQGGFEFYWGTKLLAEYRSLTQAPTKEESSE
jgi:hypothetical protein